MAKTITITCPECDKQLIAPGDAAGKKIRCKGCGATFSVRGNEDKPPVRAAKPDKAKPARKEKAKEPDDPFSADTKAFGMKDEYLGRRCPDCANGIGDDDRICLHCGYDTLTRTKAQIRKVQEITGGDVFLWLLPGILCALLVFVLLGALTYYWLAISRETFGDVWYDFLGGLGCKVYTSVICLGIIYKAGKFAILRLCVNYMPPEVELKLSSDK